MTDAHTTGIINQHNAAMVVVCQRQDVRPTTTTAPEVGPSALSCLLVVHQGQLLPPCARCNAQVVEAAIGGGGLGQQGRLQLAPSTALAGRPRVSGGARHGVATMQGQLLAAGTGDGRTLALNVNCDVLISRKFLN